MALSLDLIACASLLTFRPNQASCGVERNGCWVKVKTESTYRETQSDTMLYCDPTVGTWHTTSILL